MGWVVERGLQRKKSGLYPGSGPDHDNCSVKATRL